MSDYADQLNHDAARRQMEGTMSDETVSERLWKRVDKNGPIQPHCAHLGQCWIWKGSTDQKGYGQMSVNGRTEKTHRLVFALSCGEIPDGGIVMHLCDNPSCVRPSHLMTGTQSDNLLDCSRKGRNGQTVMASRTNKCRNGHVYTLRRQARKQGVITARYCRTCFNAKRRENERLKKGGQQ